MEPEGGGWEGWAWWWSAPTHTRQALIHHAFRWKNPLAHPAPPRLGWMPCPPCPWLASMPRHVKCMIVQSYA